MTDGMSAVACDERRVHARARVRFEIYRFALGERGEAQRTRVLEAAHRCDEIRGKGIFTNKMERTLAWAQREMEKLERGDPATWLTMADRWHADTSDFWSLEFGADRDVMHALLDHTGYRLFRRALEREVGVPVNALLFFPDEFGRWSVGHDLYRMIGAEITRRGWRFGEHGTHDRYAVVLERNFTLAVVWLGHYHLDAHNLTPDVALGPEVFRLASSKRSVA